MASEASGAANLNATIQNKELTVLPAGILGGFIVIKQAEPPMGRMNADLWLRG